MKYKDIWTIACHNIRAGKKNVIKIVFGIGCSLVLALCFMVIMDFYSDYKADFGRNYQHSCYVYNYQYDSYSISEIKEYSENIFIEPGIAKATEKLALIAVKPDFEEPNMEAKNVFITIGSTEYEAKSFFVFNREVHEDISGPTSDICIGYYDEDMVVFPDSIFHGEIDMIGELPNNDGEVLIDDYLLKVYGVDANPKELIGKNISVVLKEENIEMLAYDYIISGVFNAEETLRREGKTPKFGDNHYEHIWVNFKPEDEALITTKYFSLRAYYRDYQDMLNKYDYTKEVISNFAGTEKSEMNFNLTYEGWELCVLTWVMGNMGKLLSVIGGVIVLVILFSLFYIVRFYFGRNSKYMKMLHCIGMERKDRGILRITEMAIMLVCAILVAIYLTFIFVIVFQYITGNLLSYGYQLF